MKGNAKTRDTFGDIDFVNKLLFAKGLLPPPTPNK